MKFNVVKGRVTTLGPSVCLKNGGKVYDYIKFIDETDTEVYAQKVMVEPLVDAGLRPGIEGSFLVIKQSMLFAIMSAKSSAGQIINELAGIKSTETNAASPSVLNPSINAYMTWGVMAFGGLILSMFIIGIPILAYSIYQIIQVPLQTKKLQEVVEQEGFKVVKPKYV